MNGKITTAGMAAAPRTFTPEFMNRRRSCVRSLGTPELHRIIDIELDIVRQRIHAAAQGHPFSISVTASAKEFLLSEGTDVRYGARPFKRAIERLLVYPLSNLMATKQILHGDHIRVSHAQDAPGLLFARENKAEQAWGVGCRAA